MEQEKKQSVVGKVIDGLKESTKAVSEINKENMAAIKADSKANFIEATTPSPEFEEFKKAKGLKNKAKAVVEGFKASTKAASEKEKERRAAAQSHEGYRELLKEQREHRQAAIHRK